MSSPNDDVDPTPLSGAPHTGALRLREYMVTRARFRDHIYFASDSTAARDLGVSRRTIIRWRSDLERSGKVERCGWHHWKGGKKTVVYRICGLRVTQRTSRRSPSLIGLGFKRTCRTNAYERRCTRRQPVNEIVPSGAGPPAERERTARDVLIVVCDTFSAKGIPLPSRHKGIIARQSKELLDDGFDFETVVVSSVIALRRAQPQNLHFIATDLVMARAGERMTRREYERALQDEMELRGR